MQLFSGVSIFSCFNFCSNFDKNRRLRRALWFIYLRRVDFSCMNIGWNLWWKIINFGIVFDALTFGVSIFSYQKRRQYYWVCWESQIEVPKFLKIEKRSKSTQNHILFFVASGTGKIVRDDFWSKANAFSYSICFRNLKMRFRNASCRNFRNNSYLGIQTKINRIKKVIISENSEKQMTTLWGRNWFFKVNIWRDPVGWLAGWHARSAIFSFNY